MWRNINVEKPKYKEPVFYYFNFFGKVYAGYYECIDISKDLGYAEGNYLSDCFYSDHGFLNDDVKWWMPREEGNINLPEPPFKPNMLARDIFKNRYELQGFVEEYDDEESYECVKAKMEYYCDLCDTFKEMARQVIIEEEKL